jgi:2-methylcitrate dehydratase PrpD
MATGVKPYPSCRWGHAAIDAALALREELGLNPEEIEGATLGISHAGLLLIGEPAVKKADPQNVVDGQFSGPFVIAVALATGKMDWDSYKLLDDPLVRRLLPRIVCENDPEIEAEFPANMSGKLTLRARGQVFTRKVIVPKGEPSAFPSEVDLRTKFIGLAGAVLGPSTAAKMVENILRLDQLNDGATILCHAHREEVTPSRVLGARH